jgi:hypothetical protein
VTEDQHAKAHREHASDKANGVDQIVSPPIARSSPPRSGRQRGRHNFGSIAEWALVTLTAGVLIVYIFQLLQMRLAVKESVKQSQIATESTRAAYRPWIWVDAVHFEPITSDGQIVMNLLVRNTGASAAGDLSVFSQIEADNAAGSRDTLKERPPYISEVRLWGSDVVTFQSGIDPGQQRPVRLVMTPDKPIGGLIRDIESGSVVINTVITIGFSSTLVPQGDQVVQFCYYYDATNKTANECKAQEKAKPVPFFPTGHISTNSPGVK